MGIKANGRFGILLGFAAFTVGPLQGVFAAEDTESSLQEIVVTAQRRAEKIQDVPVSITAFTGKSLVDNGITEPVDLGSFVPGLSAKNTLGNGSAVFTLRGIGLNDFGSNNNPNVSVYVDDILLPYVPLLNFQMFDTDRVEVLKGPQGTLYGRNTTGGAIRYITRRPTDTDEFSSRVDFGNYGLVEAEVAGGGKINDAWNYRVSFITRQQDRGWQHDYLTGQNIGSVNRSAIRLQLDFHPSATFDMLLEAWTGYENSENQIGQDIAELDRNTGAYPCAPVAAGYRDEGPCVAFSKNGQIFFNPNSDPRQIAASPAFGNRLRNTAAGASAELVWHLPSFTLTSITGVTVDENETATDSSATPFVLLDNMFNAYILSPTEELRASSLDDSRIKWTTGVYASDDKNRGELPANLDDNPFAQTRVYTRWDQKDKSYAGYGQAELPIVDKLSLVGGARLTYEEKSDLYESRDLNPFGTSGFVAAGLIPVAAYAGSISETNASWKFGVNYRPTNAILTYASVTRGFKSGGFFDNIAFSLPELTPYKPEILTAYEVGIETAWNDGRVIANAAAYHYDWRNFQASGLVCVGSPAVCVITLTNVGDARIDGLEAELNWQPVDGLVLHLGANELNSRVKDGPYMGKRVANAPNLTLDTNVRYELPRFANGWRPYVQVSDSYQSTEFFENNNFPLQTEPGYSLVNLRVGTMSRSDAQGSPRTWDVAAWVHNLTNKIYRTESFNSGSFIPSQNYYGPPRTFGVSLNYHY
jgi:iron complex outermembrane receptor protein